MKCDGQGQILFFKPYQLIFEFCDHFEKIVLPVYEGNLFLFDPFLYSKSSLFFFRIVSHTDKSATHQKPSSHKAIAGM